MPRSVAFRKLHTDTEKRIVTAIVSVISDHSGQPIVDHDDDRIHIDDLELAFEKSFSRGGQGMGGEMHKEVGGANVIAHFTFSKDEWAAFAAEFEIPEMANAPEVGIAKLRVIDDDLWEAVKAGAYPEMSIAGSARRKRVA